MHKARIFISYSHRGNGPEWKADLLRALHVFEQHHLLDVWQDGKIRVSSFWDDDIRQAMDDARLAIVLLTKEALESEFILETEFPTLRERRHRGELLVFPVVCEDCDWRAHDWLRATRAPNESRPLSQVAKRAQDRDRNEQGGSTNKMLSVFEDWFARRGYFGARQLAVPRILDLFHRLVEAGCLGALRKPPVIEGLTVALFRTRRDADFNQANLEPLLGEDWNTATAFLADFGLIMSHAYANRMDKPIG